MSGSWDMEQEMIELGRLEEGSEKLELVKKFIDEIPESEVVSKQLDIPVKISKKVYVSILESMKEYAPDDEISLMVNKNEDGVFDEIYCPPQVGYGGSVDFQNRKDLEGWDGIVHSHHNMSADFSGIDEHGINANYDTSILVAWKSRGKSLDMDSRIRPVVLEDKIFRGYSDVVVKEYQPDISEFMNQVDKNFKTGWEARSNRTYSYNSKSKTITKKKKSDINSDNKPEPVDEDEEIDLFSKTKTPERPEEPQTFAEVGGLEREDGKGFVGVTEIDDLEVFIDWVAQKDCDVLPSGQVEESEVVSMVSVDRPEGGKTAADFRASSGEQFCILASSLDEFFLPKENEDYRLWFAENKIVRFLDNNDNDTTNKYMFVEDGVLKTEDLYPGEVRPLAVRGGSKDGVRVIGKSEAFTSSTE